MVFGRLILDRKRVLPLVQRIILQAEAVGHRFMQDAKPV